MAKRNPQCTTFIRNFNARGVVSNWGRDIDMQPNNVIEPRCFTIGQQANMQAEHDKAVRKQELAANLAELDRLLESL